MYLRQLELRGFKSFAKGTEIQFKPGLNIIVGPNGCGKSNIVDAIRWVLGEGNIRNLRGQRAEDVIFTGSDQKKPLGYASVSIIIDNQDRGLDCDFSEVTVTRKVFRGGESEFYINRNAVRLKEIQHLFAGTGLGKKGYSIIGQGELDQVLNAKPFERRLILEEAAGISAYRQKKEEAQSRLQTTGQDLVRVKDILAELESRLADLQERARRAREHLAQSQELGALERRVLAYDLFLFQEEVKVRVREMAELEGQLQELQEAKAAQETVLQEVEAGIEKSRQQITELKEEQYSLGTEINRLESEIRLAEERVGNAGEQSQQLETDVTRYQAMLAKIEEDLILSRDNLSGKEEELAARKEEADRLGSAIKETKESLAAREQEMETLKNELIDLLNRESAYKHRLAEKEDRKKKYEERSSRGEHEATLRREKIETLRENLGIWEKDVFQVRRELETLGQETQRVLEEKGQINSRIAEGEKEGREAAKEQRELQTQLLNLEEAIKSHAGYAEGVRKLLTATRKNPNLVPGLLGVMADLLEVPAGLEVALEAAAGRGLENVVVKNDKDARLAIDLLKSNSWGRVTFLPLNLLRPALVEANKVEAVSKLPGVIGLASELVGYRPEYRKAVQHLLGRVLVVEDLNVGLLVFKKHPFFRIVTREGDLINPGGAITGGRGQNRTQSPLQRKSQYRVKSKQLAEKKRQLDKVQSLLDHHLALLKSKDEELQGLQKQASEKVFRLEMLAKEMERARQEEKELQEEINLLLAEERMAHKELEKLNDELSHLYREVQDLKAYNEQATLRLETVKQEKEGLAHHLDLMQERYNHCQELVAARERELKGQGQSVQQLETVRDSYRQNLSESQAQLARLERVIKLESTRMRDLNVNKEEADKKMTQLEELLQALEKGKSQLLEQAQGVREGLHPLREQATAWENRLRNLEMRKIRTETEEKNARNSWDEKFTSEDYRDFWEGMTHRQQREMHKRAEALRQSLEALGPVDLGSIKELDEVSKRHDFLNGQMNDLLQACESLNRIIEETGILMNRSFNDFLELADASFRKTFTTIFRGGEARLQLEDTKEEPAGVEILVKMPGKRRQSLNLLSGGERALTCIAFLFSLLVLKPVPFCMLDEIDAALDDVNLARFRGFLTSLGQTMQFIIITHRQGTIEAGETIYGVTMPEQGVSRVLSLSVKEAESLAV